MAGYEHTLTQGLILLTTPDFSNAYISDKNATKLSGYDPLGVEKDYWAEGPSDRPKAHQNSPTQELE